jgi:two-component system, cell cycle sensor histidine kinase and response regulator CckA
MITANGRPIWVRTQCTCVTEGGKVVRLVGAFHDITERKRAESERELLERELREAHKMESIGTLAGGIAHDFNNILATILGNTALARSDVSANPDAALESLEEIQKAAARARDLVQQILSFSRRSPTEKKPIELMSVVEESARLLRATLPGRLKLRVNCAAGGVVVLADQTQILQVLINLATNAMQAMREGPGCINMVLDSLTLDAVPFSTRPQLHALHASHPEHVARLVVSDDGPGMDAATLERLFEPFFTTKPPGEGTGLGLSVVHGIVQAHGGALEVQSALGKGTTFTIYLPAA